MIASFNVPVSDADLLLDAIAEIQCYRQMYWDCGIDIEPRIRSYLERQRWTSNLKDLSYEQAELLAEAIKTAYFNERSQLKILSNRALKILAEVNMTLNEWRDYFAATDEDDRACWRAAFGEEVLKELVG